MENIDDFMQRKFDSDDPAERFPFREEYWEQAQALIEADEQRRRKRRRFLFWWLCCGLLAGAGAWWLKSSPNPSGQMMDSGTSSEQSTAYTPPKSIMPDAALPETSKTTPGVSTAKDRTNQNPLGDLTNNNLDRLSNRVGDTQNQTEQNKLDKSPKNLVLNTINASKPPRQPGKKNERNKNLSNKTDKYSLTSTAQGPLPNVQQTDLPLPTPPKNNPEMPEHVQSATGENRVTNEDLSPVVDTEDGRRLSLLQALELPFPPARHAALLLPLKKIPQPFTSQLQPVHTRRLTVGADASVSSWTAGAGYAGGVHMRYQRQAPWSFLAGIQLRYQPLSPVAAPSDTTSGMVTVQYRYSFGVERTEWKRVPTGMHYLELPLAAHWQRGRLGLEAGVSPGVLLLVRENVEQTKETSLGGIETGTSRYNNGATSGFRKGYLSTFALAEFRVIPRLGLTLRGNYRPGSVLKPMGEFQPEKGFWNLDLGLRWRF